MARLQNSQLYYGLNLDLNKQYVEEILRYVALYIILVRETSRKMSVTAKIVVGEKIPLELYILVFA